MAESRAAFRVWHCGRCTRELFADTDFLRCACCGAVHDQGSGAPRPDVEAAERRPRDLSAVRVRDWV